MTDDFALYLRRSQAYVPSRPRKHVRPRLISETGWLVIAWIAVVVVGIVSICIRGN